MSALTHAEMVRLLLQVGVLLVAGRLMAEFARRLNMPTVVGELVAGVLLGPTLLGSLNPEVHQWWFPAEGHVATVMDGLTRLALVLLLFVGGLEINLGMIRSQARRALPISAGGSILSFAIGFGLGGYIYQMVPGVTEGGKLVFQLFLGTALAITALPVLVRMLLDLDMMRSSTGTVILAAAMIDDVVGWLVFSVILGMAGTTGAPMRPVMTLITTLVFSGFMLTMGKQLLSWGLPYISKRLSWPGGILSLTIALCFLCSAFTEAIGLHAIFGAFLAGVVVGDSPFMTDRAKEIVHQFVMNIFAPLFFISIGLQLNFLSFFNPLIVVLLLAGAFVGKIAGASLGARFTGSDWRESLTIGTAMNARGAMEVVLGLVALQSNLITREVFVALVIVALVTSITSAGLVKLVLKVGK